MYLKLHNSLENINLCKQKTTGVMYSFFCIDSSSPPVIKSWISEMN